MNEMMVRNRVGRWLLRKQKTPPDDDNNSYNQSSNPGSGCFAGLSFVDIPFRLSRHLPRNDRINKFILRRQLLIVGLSELIVWTSTLYTSGLFCCVRAPSSGSMHSGNRKLLVNSWSCC